MSRTSAIVIAIVTHAWRLRLWLRSSFLDGDRDCDCDWKSCDYDCDCDCDSLCFSWLCVHWNTDCDCDLNGDCDPLETRIFFDYDFGDSTTGSSSVITATSFFRALGTNLDHFLDFLTRGMKMSLQAKVPHGMCKLLEFTRIITLPYILWWEICCKRWWIIIW